MPLSSAARRLLRRLLHPIKTDTQGGNDTMSKSCQERDDDVSVLTPPTLTRPQVTQRNVSIDGTGETSLPPMHSEALFQKESTIRKDYSGMGAIGNCCICTHISEPSEASRIDSCRHEFCFDCIKKWSLRENSCPLCKKRFACIERKQPYPEMQKINKVHVAERWQNIEEDQYLGRATPQRREDSHDPLFYHPLRFEPHNGDSSIGSSMQSSL